MRKKRVKSRAEKTAEEFFKVDEADLKYAVEKPIKQQTSELEKIEQEGNLTAKIYKKAVKQTKRIKTAKYSKSIKKPRAKSTKKQTAYEPPQISLKPDGYELIITEKPQAAFKIASALGQANKKAVAGVPYYEVARNDKRIVVACAVGHLFTLKQEKNGQELPVFDIKWAPNFIVRKKDFTKKYYDLILKLAKQACSITVATDYDIEGEVIGLNIVRLICNQQDASRMKFSTLTDKELNEAYEKKSSHLDWGQAIAGEARHYLDWFYGINLSRALMNAIKTTGRFKIISIGRVQGPALKLIVQKERQIQDFKSVPYWQVFITVKNSHILELKYIKDITKRTELDKFKDLKGKTATAETKKTEQILPPPFPFDLTTLQTEAYRLFGITPSQTLKIAQSLYLSGLISYPRTSSQKLPPSIAYKEVLNQLAKKYKVEHLIKRDKPIEGNKSDPAHPSIYPTGQTQILSGQDEQMYNLIVKRFIALFCDDAVLDNKTITAKFDNLVFTTKGSAVKQKAWLEVYPIKMQEKDIPDLNGNVKIINVKTEEKQTQPPKRYSPASIVSELERRNLGTKATRANIIETLYDRDYIREKSIQATPLGISLITSLEKHSPIIIDEALTHHFEKEMNTMQESKSQINIKAKQEHVINEAKETITKIISQFNKNQGKIGKELLKATDNLIQEQRKEAEIGSCMECKKGNLMIRYNKNARRYFIGCGSYPQCKTTYTLPPGSLIKNANKQCPHCSFPMLLSIKKGKRPWIFCFNPKCPSNKERIDEYNKRKAEEEAQKDF
ncbi:DNA topoisomerase I [Candidatus Pacearchaeota archaeon]|nr:DNA topoisomerase I [Candidatus Pacearchaeota archaeon]